MWQALRRVCVVGTVLCAVCGPASAFGAGWPLAASAPIVCAYAEEYTGPDGSSSIHSGVDIAADEGDSILAIEAGTVTFSGSVPGAGGGTVVAVTVQTASGDRWSYMPFSGALVATGDTVDAGAAIGTLSGRGDGSSGASHVHVGLRRGDRYVDPTAFLVASATPATEPDPAVSECPETSPVTQAPPLPEAAGSVANAVDASTASGIQAPTVSAAPAAGGVAVAAAAGPAASFASPAGCVPSVAEAGPASATHGSMARIRELDVRGSTMQARAESPASPEAATRARAATSYATRGGVGLATRGVIALLVLSPVIGVSIKHAFRSRVSALGDTVAAAAGR